LQFFTEEEIHESQNKNYEQEILSFQQDMHENYQKFLQTLYSLFQKKKSNLSSSIIELFLPKDFVYHENEAVDASFPITKDFQLSDIASKVTYKDYQWALSIVNSRALRFHGEAHLIPMADIFNYEKHDKIRQTDNGNFFLQFHQKDPNTKAISIFADRYTESNTQLFEDYGDNTNEIYLQYHGFIPHTMNPFHCIKYDFSSFFSALSKRKGEKDHHSVSLPVEKVLTDKQFELLKLFKFPLTHMQSICLRNDGKMNRNHFVFFAILAFNEQELEICSAAFQQQQQQQQSSSSASRVNWMTIFRDCSFERVFQYYEDQLTIATNTLADPRQRKQKRKNSAEEKEVKEGEEEEEDENKSEPEKTLEMRLWEMIQFFLQSTSNSLSYPTTVEDDRNLLLSIQQWKRSFLPDNNDNSEGMPSMESMIHRELAIKYRVTNKLLYQHLCALYDLNCSQGMFQADSGENKQEKLSAVSSTAMAEVEEEAIDETVNPVTTAALRKKIADFNSWFRSYHPEPCLIEAHLFDNFYRVGTIVTADRLPKKNCISVSRMM
jgi:ribosomal protein L12E/L44/L45/RPP1/RPP2